MGRPGPLCIGPTESKWTRPNVAYCPESRASACAPGFPRLLSYLVVLHQWTKSIAREGLGQYQVIRRFVRRER